MGACASVEQADPTVWTPLHYACYKGDERRVEVCKGEPLGRPLA